jgi:hypothetical protein
MLKIDIAFVIIPAAVVAALLTCDYDSKPATRVELLGENVLTAVRGWTQSCTPQTSNVYCACNVTAANPGLLLRCTCPAGNVDQCLACTGTSYASGIFGQGNPGYDASGFNGSCGNYTAMFGSCANGQCNGNINFGPCTGSFAYASIQVPPP